MGVLITEYITRAQTWSKKAVLVKPSLLGCGGREGGGGGENMNEYESEDTRAAIQASA